MTVACGRLSRIWRDRRFFFGGGFVEDMEYHWPFAVCVTLVSVFAIGAVVLLRRYEGVKVSISRSDKVEDPYSVARVPIGYLRREELWNACGGAVNPNYLLFFRGLCLIYLLSFLGYNTFRRNLVVLFFYTEWTFTLLVVYFALAFRQSLLHYLEGRSMATVSRSTLPTTSVHPDDSSLTEPLNGGAMDKFLIQPEQETAPEVPFARGQETQVEASVEGYVTQCVFQAVLPAAVLTDLIYWGFLVPVFLPPNWQHSFIDINKHAINLVILIIEFSLNSLRFPWFRVSYFILWSTAYVSFQWICHSAGIVHYWPYPFMNVDTPYAPAWYFFIIFCHGICFAICLLLAFCKQNVCYRANSPGTERMIS